MSIVESRTVVLNLDSDDFKKGVEDTLSQVEELEDGLDFDDDVSDSFTSITKAAKKVDLSAISNQVATLSSRFDTLGIAAMTTVSNITSKLNSTAANAVGGLFDKVFSGGVNRVLNLEQAQFSLEGLLDSDKEVEEVMSNVSDAVSGTAYSLDAAATVASNLVASGVSAGTEMTSILQGIAGVAAQTGSEYSDIGQIFTTVAGNGQVMTEQLRQFSTRGLNAAAVLAEYLGKTEDEIYTMTSAGEISFEQFSAAMTEAFGDHAKDANKTFSGVCSNITSALSRIGALFVDDLLKNEGPLVKFLNVVKDRIDDVNTKLVKLSNWFEKFAKSVLKKTRKIIKNINLTKYFKIFYRTLRSIINVLEQMWRGLKKIAAGFSLTFNEKPLAMIAKTAKALREYTAGLKLTRVQLNYLRTIGEGFGAAFDIIYQLIIAIVKPIATMAGSLLPSFGGSFLEVAASIGDAVVNFRDWLEDIQFFDSLSAGIANALSFLSSGFSTWFQALSKGMDKVSSIFSGSDSLGGFWSAITDSVGILGDCFGDTGDVLGEFFDTLRSELGLGNKFADILDFMAYAADDIGYAFQTVVDVIGDTFLGLTDAISLDGLNFSTLFSNLGDSVSDGLSWIEDKFSGFFDWFGEFASKHGDSIKSALQTVFSKEFQDTLQEVLTTGLLARSIVLVQDFSYVFESLGDTIKNTGKSVAKIPTTFTKLGVSISSITDTVNKKLKGSKMASLKQFAVSVALLTASVYVLSTIDQSDLTNAMAALAGMTILIMGFSAIMSLVENKIGRVSSLTPLIQFSVSLLIMTMTVSRLGKMDTAELKQGLLGMLAVMGMMTALVAVVNVTAQAGTQGVSAASTVLAVAASLIPICLMLKLLATMDTDKMWQSIQGVLSLMLGLLAIIAAANATAQVGTKGVSSAGTILAVAAALIPICVMLKLLATMEVKKMWQAINGIESLMIAFMGIIVVTQLTGKTASVGAIGSAAVILAVAAALVPICLMIMLLSTMQLEKIKATTDLMALVLACFALVIVAANATGKNAAGTLASAAVILSIGLAMVPICVALRLLATMQLAKLITITVLMIAVLAELAIMLAMLNSLAAKGPMALVAAASVLLVSLALLPIAYALQKIAAIPWLALFNAVVAIGVVFAEIWVLLTLISACTGYGAGALLGAVAVALVAESLIPIAEALSILGDMSWDEIQRGVTAMAAALVVLAAGSFMNTIGILGGSASLRTASEGLIDLARAFAVFGNMSVENSARALENMSDALEELASVDLSSISSDGANAVSKVAKPIGDLANSIKAWNSVNLPDNFGDNLSDTATGLASFNELEEGLDNLSGDGATAIGTLAESVQKWNGVTVPEGLKENLEGLAAGIVAFGDTGGENLSTAAEPLGTLADSVRQWVAIEIPTTLTGNLQAIADGVKSFGTTLGGKKNYTSNFQTVGEALPSLATGLETWNGIGEFDYSTFSSDLGYIADGVKNFSNKDGVDGKKVSKNFRRVGNAMPYMADAMQTWQGITVPSDFATQLGYISDGVDQFGNEDLTNTATTIESIGTALQAMSDVDLTNLNFKKIKNGLTNLVNAIGKIKVTDKMSEKVTSVSSMLTSLTDSLGDTGADNIKTVAKPLGTLADSLKKWNKIKNNFNGDKFKTQMTNISESIATLASSDEVDMAGAVDNLEGISNAIQTLGSAKKIKGDNFKNNIKKVVNAVNNMTIDADAEAIATDIAEVIDTISSAADEYVSAGKKLGKSVTKNVAVGLANNKQVKAVKSAVTDLADKMKTKFTDEHVGKKMANKIADGLDNNHKIVNTAGKDVVTALLNKIKTEDNYDAFVKAGEYFMSGFASGITSGSDDATTAAAKAGSDALTALQNSVDEKSPSKATRKIGVYFGEGLSLGIQDSTSSIVSTVSQLGAAAISAMSSSMDSSNTLSIEQLFDISSLDSSLSDYTRRTSASLGALNTVMTSDAASMALMTANNAELLSSNGSLQSSVSDLRSDMARYAKAVENQESAVYVDGKRLASTIATPMNQELGKKSKRSRLAARGN